MFKSFSILVCATLLLVSPVRAETKTDKVMLVLDASGSMWGQIDNKSKIEIARSTFSTLVKDWPKEKEVGLVVYGHRQKGDCQDIETVVPVGPLNAQSLISTVNKITPKGKTPLSQSVKQAAQALKFTENKATVILISDGKETCDIDPCALGTELEKLGVDFTTHVIGFDVASLKDQAQLKCLAENTGGQFISAANAHELQDALTHTVQAPVEPPQKVVPVANLSKPKGSLTSDPKVIKGTLLTIQPQGEPDLRGYVYLYKQGQEKSLTYAYVQKNAQGEYKPIKMRMPAHLGPYTLKWITKQNQLVAENTVQVIDAEISLKVSQSATKGTQLPVELVAPDGLDGYIYLFPKGKDKEVAYDYVRPNQKQGGYNKSNLRLPTHVGSYTVKWITHKSEILAEADLEITDAKITLDVPSEAPMGTEIKVGLNAPEGLKGYIYLYAKGKEKYISYDYARAAKEGGYKKSKLRLPARPGEYVVKWVVAKNEVLAEAPLNVTQAQLSLKMSDKAKMGTEVRVTPQGPAGLTGYVYLYYENKDKYLTYGYVREKDFGGYKEAKLRLPARPGNYVVKWVSDKKEVLAEKNVTVESTPVALKAANTAKPGEKLKVTLEATPGLDGYIYLYGKGKDKHITYGYVREHELDPYQVVHLNLPEQPGDYVIKWITSRKEVLAQKEFQIAP